MAAHHMHQELQFWIPQYLLGRRCLLFHELPSALSECSGIQMSVAVSQLAHSQDQIGWTQFLEGKISTEFRTTQETYLLGTEMTQTGIDWTREFVSKLIQIPHNQWIYHNVSLHDRERGCLAWCRRQTLVQEILTLHNTNPVLIPVESCILLDLDPTDMDADDAKRQEYWVAAIRAAQTAGRRLHQGAQHCSQ